MEFTSLSQYWNIINQATVLIEPSLPFMYVPESEFTTFINSVNDAFPHLKCVYANGYCYSNEPCNTYTYDKNKRIKFTLGSQEHPYEIDVDQFMISGSAVGGSENTCILAFFKYSVPGDKTWYFGNLFM